MFSWWPYYLLVLLQTIGGLPLVETGYPRSLNELLEGTGLTFCHRQGAQNQAGDGAHQG